MLKEQDMPHLTLHPKISHMTINELNDLLSRYYDGEKISMLIDEYELDVRPGNLVSLFPPEVTDDICPYCEVPLQKKRVSRSAASYRFRKEEASCPECRHENRENCSCSSCRSIRLRMREEKNKKKRELIKVYWEPADFPPVLESALTLEDRLYLATVLRCGLDETLSFVHPAKGYKQNLSPTSDLNKEIFDQLIDRNILVPDPSSEIEAFPEEEDFPAIFYTYEVRLRVNVRGEGDLMHRLLNPDPSLFLEDELFCQKLWKKVALAESIQYLVHSMKKVGFDFTAGDKTISVMEELLEHFSTSQVFGIIYKSIANGTKFYQESRVTRQHAANSVITSCQRFGERAAAEKWDLSRFRRDFDLPQTQISLLLYDRILGIGRLGFDCSPSEKI